MSGQFTDSDGYDVLVHSLESIIVLDVVNSSSSSSSDSSIAAKFYGSFCPVHSLDGTTFPSKVSSS